MKKVLTTLLGILLGVTTFAMQISARTLTVTNNSSQDITATLDSSLVGCGIKITVPADSTVKASAGGSSSFHRALCKGACMTHFKVYLKSTGEKVIDKPTFPSSESGNIMAYQCVNFNVTIEEEDGTWKEAGVPVSY